MYVRPFDPPSQNACYRDPRPVRLLDCRFRPRACPRRRRRVLIATRPCHRPSLVHERERETFNAIGCARETRMIAEATRWDPYKYIYIQEATATAEWWMTALVRIEHEIGRGLGDGSVARSDDSRASCGQRLPAHLLEPGSFCFGPFNMLCELFLTRLHALLHAENGQSYLLQISLGRVNRRRRARRARVALRLRWGCAIGSRFA